MGDVSSEKPKRVRKTPEERRAEIIAEASRVALEEGLERITLRLIANELDVRPGLITHYFPAAEDLVVAAFERAIALERGWLFGVDGSAKERLRGFLRRVNSSDAHGQASLWLNARHLARFTPKLETAILEQEEIDRGYLVAIIAQGLSEGVFETDDAEAACVRIFMAVDGYGSYVNTLPVGDTHEAFQSFVSDVCEWALGLQAGELRNEE